MTLEAKPVSYCLHGIRTRITVEHPVLTVTNIKSFTASTNKKRPARIERNPRPTKAATKSAKDKPLERIDCHRASSSVYNSKVLCFTVFNLYQFMPDKSILLTKKPHIFVRFFWLGES